MPFNGVGTFDRIYSWVADAAAGLLIDSDRMDTDTDDIASGLSLCITRDGQSTPIANLPMAGFKLTGLGAGSNVGDSINYGQVFGVNVVFNAPMAAASPAIGDNSLLLATTAFVAQTAFSAALPTQPGGTSLFQLESSNGVAFWTNLAGEKASNQYALNLGLRFLAYSQ